jgi:hydroxypyruvate reductase
MLQVADLNLPLTVFDRIFVVGAGKAAAPMAQALKKVIGRTRIDSGIVVVKHGHGGAVSRGSRIQIREAGHPIPDRGGFEAALDVEAMLRQANARDLVLVLISGGASALLPSPVPPVSLADKQKTTDLLLRAGADIFELNTVRKHLSLLKGGRLAALAYPATVVALMLSDVIGDPLSVIGSGPTVPDETTYGDALRVLEKFKLTTLIPRSALDILERGARGELPETPKPGDPLFENVHNIIVGSNRLALDAAAAKARDLGYRPLILSSTLRGESRVVAQTLAEIAREVLATGQPLRPPVCLLAGGETTVTVRGRGKGGRNQEFALAAAIALEGLSNWLVLSAGTDGTDGPTDAAGAIADGTTVARAAARKKPARAALENNNSHAVFQSIEDLVETGPTGTNVMDIHLFLVV